MAVKKIIIVGLDINYYTSLMSHLFSLTTPLQLPSNISLNMCGSQRGKSNLLFVAFFPSTVPLFSYAAAGCCL